MKKAILLAYFIISATCYAQTVIIKEKDGIVNLAKYSYLIEDRGAKLTIEDILNNEVDRSFRKVDKENIHFGITKSVVWIRCTVRNETDQDLVVDLGRLLPTDVWLYEFDSTRLLQKHHTGRWMPFKMRETTDVNVQFELALKSHVTGILYLRVSSTGVLQFPLIVGTKATLDARSTSRNFFEGMFYGLMLAMALYNLFLYFSLKDIAYFYYFVYILLITYWNACINGHAFKYLWPSTPYSTQIIDSIAGMAGIASILFAVHFLHTKQIAPRLHKLFQTLVILFVADLIVVITGNSRLGLLLLEIFSSITVLALSIAAYVMFRRGYKPAGYFLIAWLALFIGVVVFVLKDFNVIPYNSYTWYSIQVGSAIEAVLLSIALANRINIYKKEKEQANLAVLRSLEENKKLITEQNIILERKVEERTTELKKANHELVTTLKDLNDTQAQLVQREKMASLGELTAGIAHEIQNPLNFVNNFSDVNTELLEELEQEADKGNIDEVKYIAKDIKENELKINHHGKRADAIVKGMLQHSRASTGKKEPTDINALADEYLRLSYQGLRAKDKEFNANLTTQFDESIGKIEVAPKDIGRVLLNLYNNAFYSVNIKKAQLNGTFEPAVEVTTKRVADKVEIRVKDNGTGIPQKALDKIFQPFFTTKPTGQGTGLGLSLSYDIVTQGHGGEIKIDTVEGEGVQFTVCIPINN